MIAQLRNFKENMSHFPHKFAKISLTMCIILQENQAAAADCAVANSKNHIPENEGRRWKTREDRVSRNGSLRSIACCA
jgi:hypothetical protein